MKVCVRAQMLRVALYVTLICIFCSTRRMDLEEKAGAGSSENKYRYEEKEEGRKEGKGKRIRAEGSGRD